MLGHGPVGHVDADALDALGLAGFVIDRQAPAFHPAPLAAAMPVAEDDAVFPARLDACAYGLFQPGKIHRIHQLAERGLRAAEGVVLQAEYFLELLTPLHTLIVEIQRPDAHSDPAITEERCARGVEICHTIAPFHGAVRCVPGASGMMR